MNFSPELILGMARRASERGITTLEELTPEVVGELLTETHASICETASRILHPENGYQAEDARRFWNRFIPLIQLESEARGLAEQWATQDAETAR